jgi:hypothetical protein
MKIIIGALIFALFLLGIRYLDLYFDKQALAAELTRQQSLHTLQREEQKKHYLKTIEALEQFLVFNPTNNTQPQGSGKNAYTATNNAKSSGDANTLENFSLIRDESLQRAVSQKYGIVLGGLSLSGHDERNLQDLLLERERILGASTVGYHSTPEEITANLSQQQELLAEIDHKIAQLLGPEEAEQYDLLKDSGFEQYQMSGFYEELGGKETVPQEAQRKLLLAKLEQKQNFSSALDDLNADFEQQPDEREATLKKMQEAVNDYKENYLRQARDLLTPEQFDQLREFEQQQYDEMWSSLEAGLQAQSN